MRIIWNDFAKFKCYSNIPVSMQCSGGDAMVDVDTMYGCLANVRVFMKCSKK